MYVVPMAEKSSPVSNRTALILPSVTSHNLSSRPLPLFFSSLNVFFSYGACIFRLFTGF